MRRLQVKDRLIYRLGFADFGAGAFRQGSAGRWRGRFRGVSRPNRLLKNVIERSFSSSRSLTDSAVCKQLKEKLQNFAFFEHVAKAGLFQQPAKAPQRTSICIMLNRRELPGSGANSIMPIDATHLGQTGFLAWT